MQMGLSKEMVIQNQIKHDSTLKNMRNILVWSFAVAERNVWLHESITKQTLTHYTIHQLVAWRVDVPLLHILCLWKFILEINVGEQFKASSSFDVGFHQPSSPVEIRLVGLKWMELDWSSLYWIWLDLLGWTGLTGLTPGTFPHWVCGFSIIGWHFPPTLWRRSAKCCVLVYLALA